MRVVLVHHLSCTLLFYSVISQAPEKKSRPLSATRKSKLTSDKMDDNTEEIIKAMAEENKSVGKKLLVVKCFYFFKLNLGLL